MEGIKGLSSNKIQTIILQIQEKRCLWDKTDYNYKDQNLKEIAWNKIGKVVELPSDRVKKVWNHLRDTRTRYMRQDKNTSSNDSASKRRKIESWKWSEALEFLSTGEYTTINNINVFDYVKQEQDTQSENGFNVEENENFSPPPTPLSSQSYESQEIRPRRRQKQQSSEEMETFYMSYLKKKQESEYDEDVEADKLWLLSLLPNFKGMPLNQKNRIKYAIQGVFLEIDDPPAIQQNTSMQQVQTNIGPTVLTLPSTVTDTGL